MGTPMPTSPHSPHSAQSHSPQPSDSSLYSHTHPQAVSNRPALPRNEEKRRKKKKEKQPRRNHQGANSTFSISTDMASKKSPNRPKANNRSSTETNRVPSMLLSTIRMPRQIPCGAILFKILV